MSAVGRRASTFTLGLSSASWPRRLLMFASYLACANGPAASSGPAGRARLMEAAHWPALAGCPAADHNPRACCWRLVWAVNGAEC